MGMTQDEFAEHCGISRISVARFEASGNIGRASAEKIAKACGVSVSFVLGDTSRLDAEQDDDSWELRERLRRDPNMRMLFSAASRATPDHIRAAAEMLKALEPPTFPDESPQEFPE